MTGRKDGGKDRGTYTKERKIMDLLFVDETKK